MDLIEQITAPVERFDLKEKVVIVTGSARGIGRAIAESFVLAGANVLAVDMLDSVLRSSSEHMENWHGFQADVSQPAKVAKMVDFCTSKLGTPEILINIAAISSPSPVREMTLENWRMNIDVNLSSVFLCTHAVVPHMIQRKRGAIISFSSVIARTGGEMSAHYAAAKAGIEGFSKSLAREVGPYGIRVNVISPGMIDTEMLKLMPQKQKQKLVERLPLRRIGYPEDLVGLALLLASSAGSYITGQTIHVNGGLFMD
ncbi:MAG: 3-oxoacyl-ACP reductase family protein [Candidatus Desulfacyla sp.]